MAEHQTLNTVIHAAFRRDLRRFEDALARLAPGDTARASQLVLAWDHYAGQLHDHHTHEETIFWPALLELGVDESLMGDLDGEHERMAHALDVASAAMAVLREDPDAAHVAQARCAMAEFSTTLHEHLAHEERDLEPLTVQHASSAPMRAAAARVRKANKNPGRFFAWLQDGADAEARAGLRRTVPAPVVYVLTTVGGRGYRRTIAPTWT